MNRKESQPHSAGRRIENLFAPGAVAVIGVSRKHGAIGSELFGNILRGGFKGRAFPVNPNALEVQGVRSYRAIEDLPCKIDLGVICIPAHKVPQAASACAKKGAGALIVISSGFAEVGAEGITIQQELDSVCRSHNILLVGPNCMGIANTAPNVRLHATFGPTAPAPGSLGFLTQSGAVGLGVIQSINGSGTGFSSYLSVGNSAGLPLDQVLEFWESDPSTKVIGMYLESIPNPLVFIETARKVSRKKPIVVLKAGRFSSSQRAALSHTAAMTSQSDELIDYALASAGVARAGTMDELIDLLIFYSSQSAPLGPKVCIITNGGGAGILSSDSCESNGLILPEPSKQLNQELAELIPHSGSSGNPIDLLAMASAATFCEVLRDISKSQEYDSIIVIYLDPIANKTEDTLKKLINFIPGLAANAPICLTVIPTIASHQHQSYTIADLPVFALPETPAKCLAAALKPFQARSRLEEPIRARCIDTSIIKEDRTGWLTPSEIEELLDRNKLPTLKSLVAQSPKEAQAIAEEIGAPVAIRAAGPGIIHKTELGAISLNVSPESVELAANQICAHLLKHHGITPASLTVQRMAKPGVELFIGMSRDPGFGPVVAFGAGGINVEILKDIKFAIQPINRSVIRTLLSELRIYPLLLGHRGTIRSKIDEFIDMIEIIASLSMRCSQIAEIDLNPILLSPEEALIIDARIRVISKVEALEYPAPARRS